MLSIRYLKALGVLALGVAVCGAVQPVCTMTVSPWQPLQSILETAPPGAIVCLTAGVWTQGISIKDKIFTLWGAGKDQTLFVGTGGPLADGISVSGRSLVTMRGLGIYNFRDGIVVSDSSHVSVYDVHISGNDRYGVHVLGMGQVLLEHTLIAYNHGGIFAEDSAHVTVQYSYVLHNREDGIWMDFASWAWLIGNTITNNGRYGIRLYSLESLFVCRRNIVKDNKAGDFYPAVAAQRCQS